MTQWYCWHQKLKLSGVAETAMLKLNDDFDTTKSNKSKSP